MGTIKTKFNKVSSTALQKVSGRLRRHQLLHDSRAAAGAGGVQVQVQAQPQATSQDCNHHHQHDDKICITTSISTSTSAADPRIPPEPLDPVLITAQLVPPASNGKVPFTPARPVQANTSSGITHSPDCYGSEPSSTATSTMSFEYTTLAPASAVGMAAQGGGTHSSPIDLTMSPTKTTTTGARTASESIPIPITSPTAGYYYGNSPTNPIDLTTKSSPPQSAAINANRNSCVADVSPPPLPSAAMSNYMDLDDFGAFPDMAMKTSDEDDFLEYRFRDVEDEQMRQDEALARELQSDFDRADGLKGLSSPLSPHPNNTGFTTAAATASSSSSHSSFTSSSPTVPADKDEDVIRAYGQAALQIRCTKCNVPVVENPAELVTQTSGYLGSKMMCSRLECPLCGTATCMSCKVAVADSDASRTGTLLATTTSPGETTTVSLCCASDRVCMIWLLSCGQQIPPTQPTFSKGRILRNSIKGRIGGSAAADNKKQNPTTSVLNTFASSSKSAYSKGVGYGGEDVYPASHNPFKAAAAKTPSDSPAKGQLGPEDQKLAAYFRTMALVLPSYERTYAFDIQPDGQIACFLRRSPLLQKAAELLRNDSIDDILAKEELYRATISFIQALAGHVVTARLVHTSLVIYPVESQTLAVSVGPVRLGLSNGKGKTKAAEKTHSLASIVSKLGDLCRRVTTRAAAHQDEFMAEDGMQMISLCHSIIALDDFLTANKIEEDSATAALQAARMADHPPSRSEAELAEERARKHREWHRQNCLADVLDEELWKNYYFATTAKQLQISQKGRMKRLITEITNLSSSLPEGIFLRHAGSRLDTMKVLIVGPQGTPYENGLFEFDLFCPLDYPQVPPSMQFKTTGGGVVRFNPNLYEDGKVCLSLLGTWQGPAWDPSNSTILQVLVSIQGMVFCDKPWYNEPGRERQPNESASDNYNRGIHEWTVQHAMLKWLSSTASSCASLRSAGGGRAIRDVVPLSKNASRPMSAGAISSASRSADEYIWGDVVREHFSAHGRAIIETVKKWKAKGQKNSRIGTLAIELNQAMTVKGYLS